MQEILYIKKIFLKKSLLKLIIIYLFQPIYYFLVCEKIIANTKGIKLENSLIVFHESNFETKIKFMIQKILVKP